MLADKLLDILKYYCIGEIIKIEAVNKGISSNTQLIHSTTGKYVLRSLRGWQQGVSEYIISEKLMPYDIAPQVMVSKAGEPYVEADGLYYNLQCYVPHTPFQKALIDFERMVQCKHMLETLHSFEGLLSMLVT